MQILPLLTKFLLTAVLSVFVLRMACQLSRVNVHNRLVLWIVQLTDLCVDPVRKILPALYGRYVDFAALLVSLIIAGFSYLLFFYAYYGVMIPFGALLLWSCMTLLSLLLGIYFWATLITVVLSWVAPFSMHPVAELARELIKVPVDLLRQYIPSLAGLDFSPMIFMLLLTLIDSLIIGSVRVTFQVPLIFSLGF